MMNGIRGGVILFFLLAGLLSRGLEAQQLTRFAVVDLPRVYLSFFRDSRAVREFEERSGRVQREIDRMSQEIRELDSSRVGAESRGDREQALRLESDIYRKSEFLKEYYRVQTADLEDQKKKLSQSGTFLEQVYDEIARIAQSEGYSMVLNLKENTGILWYSPSVDITDRIIESLAARANR
jgi:outer membrane protein